MQFILVVILVLFTLAAAAEEAVAAEAVLPQAKPGCTYRCGNLTIPYPFGIGPDCYMTKDFSVRCNTSTKPLTAMWDASPIAINNIYLAEGEMQIAQYVAYDCYDSQGWTNSSEPWLAVPPFTISHTRNKFIAIGCDAYALFRGYRADEERYVTGCMSICDNLDSVEQSCSGVGCCQTDIPRGLKNYTVRLDSYYNHTYILDFNPCSYAFIVEEGKFTFSPNTSFKDLSNTEKLPTILNWEIGEGPCDEAQKKYDYACKANSKCVNRNITDELSGYICHCQPGYQGNPYLLDGCQDIDECKVSKPCTNGRCENSPGSYSCLCDKGYRSNGTNNQSCIKEVPKNIQSPRSCSCLLYH
ncbi:putative EGF-like domain, wall-associated receptor kinase, galacturonan-binding protein [Rosa chinensis]|uniref:Putative EGF-like domain, wall-associated receptor kinase, galacturonan-binding protein n=1 Tax=Rosa chinensis TaxID=74649 RepID=A0A2P6Q6A7_ROSCH|nr:putative EGF-like domain, wall-associated receptor kinase, galacturonan-binding protein [Rosa chinensis]